MNNTTLNTDVQRFAETCTKTVLDIVAEKETVLSFVSQDSYKEKIELISAAEDMVNRRGKKVQVRFYPKGFEHSVKDDKIHILATGYKFK